MPGRRKTSRRSVRVEPSASRSEETSRDIKVEGIAGGKLRDAKIIGLQDKRQYHEHNYYGSTSNETDADGEGFIQIKLNFKINVGATSRWIFSTIRKNWMPLMLVGQQAVIMYLMMEMNEKYDAILESIKPGSLVFTFLHETIQAARLMMNNMENVKLVIKKFLNELDDSISSYHLFLTVELVVDGGVQRHRTLAELADGPLWKIDERLDTRIAIRTSSSPEQTAETEIPEQGKRKTEQRAHTNISVTDACDLGTLRGCLDTCQKRKENLQKLKYILSSVEKQEKLKHLMREIETITILDSYKQGLYSTYLPSSLRVTSKGEESSRQEEDNREFHQELLDQIKHGIMERKSLFPLLGDIIKRDKIRIAHLHAKTAFLKQALPGLSIEKEHNEEADVSLGQWEPTREHNKQGSEMVGEASEVTKTKPGEDVQSEKDLKSTDTLREEKLCLEKVDEVEEDLERMKIEIHHQEEKLIELSGKDEQCEWEYNMEYLSQQLASIRIQEFITDIIGENDIPVLVDRAYKSVDCCIKGRHDKIRCQVYQLRDFQYGNYRNKKQMSIMSILTDVIGDDQKNSSSLRKQSDYLERVYGFGPVYIVGEPDSPRSSPICCPAMILNRERVRGELAVLGDTELVNTEASGGHHHTDQFKEYTGTCSLPIPLSPSTTRYWETHTCVQVKVDVSRWPLLEMGVTEEGQLDRSYWVSRQHRSSWAVCVADCGRHPGICTMVWKAGSQVGECQPDPVSKTPGTDRTLRYGVVVDVARGRLSFIDLDREKVLHKFDIEFTQTLFPMFGVWLYPDDVATKMTLVTGSDIAMTDKKKSLIFTALS